MEKKEEILRVRNLDISFETTAGVVNAVRGVNLTVNRGETVAIVGAVSYTHLDVYKRQYRKLAAYFIDERGRDPEFFHKEAAARSWSRTDYMDKQPPSYMQNHKPVREQDTVEGHAVRCM